MFANNLPVDTFAYKNELHICSFFFFLNGPSNKAIRTLSQFYEHTPKEYFAALH